MDIVEILKTLPKSEIIDFVIDNYEERAKENQKSHLDKYQEEIKLLDRIISQYFFLSYVIRDSNEKDKFPGRFFFGRHYISVIANNLYIIRELFIKGFHVQFQQLLRSQFEYINNLIAFIGDDDFFKRFGTSNGKDILISPKPIHAEKSIQKLFKEFSNNDPENVWKIFKEIMNFIYKDLSEAAHGNIPRIALQSLSQKDSQVDFYTQNICGVESPLPVTVNMLRQSINYFQITSRLVWIQIEKKDMLDKKSPFLEFVDYYKDKFELISNENASTQHNVKTMRKFSY